MSRETTNEGFDEWLDAIGADEGYYLECTNGHGSLPPRRVCPHCSSQDLSRTPLPESGRVETFTVTHVATPNFAEDTPYATTIVDFGSVRLTGQLIGIEPDAAEVGMEVTVDVGTTETTGERRLVFRPL